ncbi:MAG: DUF1588 domain-containing protein [Rubripirellula sp.]
MHSIRVTHSFVFALLLSVSVCADSPLPQPASVFLSTYCIDCHDGEDAEAGISLSEPAVDWRDSETVKAWETVHEMIRRGIMPPPDADQPTPAQRERMLSWVDEQLIAHGPIGGTPFRRLSRREYVNSIRAVFGIRDFQVPAGFPPDNYVHGFDNQGAGLALSGSHMESLAETANLIADTFFPPAAPPQESKKYSVEPEEMVISYSSACLIDGAMRLASSGSKVVRNATWPTKFEAPASGVYEVEVVLSTMNPPEGQTPTLLLSSMTASDRKNLTDLGEFEIQPGEPQTIQTQVELNRGDTLVFRYNNGPFNYDEKPATNDFLFDAFKKEPRLAAAWLAVGDPARGGNGWLRLKEELANPELDVAAATEEAIKDLALSASKNSVSAGETLVYKYFEEGPNIGIHHVGIQGPVKPIRDRDEIKRDQLQSALLGEFQNKTDQKSVQGFLRDLLTKLFRRPATQAEIKNYANLAREEAQSGDFDQGMHLALRTALMSPSFLFRCTSEGQLTEAELATRLSFFLTSGPPDPSLLKVAANDQLGKSSGLRKQAANLIKKRSSDFVKDFTSQWLELWKLDQLMPDARLVKRFDDRQRETMKREVEQTFQHILKSNLPVTDFITPDFLFTDSIVGWEIYQIDQFKPVKKKSRAAPNKGIVKVQIPRDGRHGGLLGMSAVMMATANGVDTQPVLRGVWLLENVLGDPPPDPPDAVPALTPDTTNASTPKEKLAAHMSDSNCATCHREIDPLGFALENFDPVGRWREHYPIYTENEKGNATVANGHRIDATGIMPDGSEFTDVTDLKKWLTAHPELFARCLSEKLLTYATGRSLSYRERQVVARIVEEQKAKNELRFQSLLLALIDCEVFRAK